MDKATRFIWELSCGKKDKALSKIAIKRLADLIEQSEAHANHVEANNSEMRQRRSPFRRKTNTYAKSKNNLQRILNVYWVIHNYVRPHFTTEEVPAVRLGIVEKTLNVKTLFSIQYV